MHVVVTQAFEEYCRGQIIDDDNTIEEIIKSEHSGKVVIVDNAAKE